MWTPVQSKDLELVSIITCLHRVSQNKSSFLLTWALFTFQGRYHPPGVKLAYLRILFSAKSVEWAYHRLRHQRLAWYSFLFYFTYLFGKLVFTEHIKNDWHADLVIENRHVHDFGWASLTLSNEENVIPLFRLSDLLATRKIGIDSKRALLNKPRHSSTA